MNFQLKHTLSWAWLVIVLIIAGCQKAPINGDLDGRWQILTIETEEGVFDVKDRQFYYNFYMHVCNLSVYGGIITEANLLYEDDRIFLNFPYIETPEEYFHLTEFGIYSNPVEFQVLYIDKKGLVMQSEESLITLRKF
ncbi:MAG: lipocalin-like domain-containing protein [Muribaculaceae bacterium]|nr:lipocalin-like domain-containing protein [Muribaculaceae bacterium]